MLSIQTMLRKKSSQYISKNIILEDPKDNDQSVSIDESFSSIEKREQKLLKRKQSEISEQQIDSSKLQKTQRPEADSSNLSKKLDSNQRRKSFRESQQKFASSNDCQEIESKYLQISDHREKDLLFDALNSCSMIITPANFNLDCQQQSKQDYFFYNTMRSLVGRKGYQNQARQSQLIEILKISSHFFEQLPNKLRELQLGHRDSQILVKRSNTMLNLKSEQISRHQSNFKSQNQKDKYLRLESVQQNDFPLIFYELKDELQELLGQKIYTPYFISHSTILQFQKSKETTNKYSVLDILDLFINERINKTKFYFKVNKFELKKNTQKAEVNESINSSVLNKASSSIGINKAMSATYDKPGVKKSQEIQFLYYEFDIKILSLPDSHFLRNVSDSAEKVQTKDIRTLLFVINEITGIMKYQQKIIDQMYLDAIECNYSHEQMTPLNSILANSQIIYRRILATMKFQEQVLEKSGNHLQLENTKRNNVETMKLLKAIEQSGQIMWFYNQNQIQRIKIQKNEFKKSLKNNTNVESIIEKVINPFEPQINSRNIKVLISWDQDYSSASLKFDLVMYQLILFNIIQNSVKYNQYNGNILVILRVRPIVMERECYESHQENKECININTQQNQKNNKKWQFDNADFIATHVLETEIIDTGIGINFDRQKMLFEPFLELKIKQNFQDVKDNNIGMGLACSHEITKQLGGDIILQKSCRGLTVFSFKLPIQIENFDPEIKLMSISEQEEKPNQKKTSQNYQKIEVQELQKSLQEYVKEKKLQTIKRIEFKEIQMTSNSKAQSAVSLFIKKKKDEDLQIRKNCGSFSDILIIDSPMVQESAQESSSQSKQVENKIQRSRTLNKQTPISQNQLPAQIDQVKQKKLNTMKNKLKLSANHIVGFYKNIISNEQSSQNSVSRDSSFENNIKSSGQLGEQGSNGSLLQQNQPNKQFSNKPPLQDNKSANQVIINQIDGNKSGQKINQKFEQNQIIESVQNDSQIQNQKIQQQIKEIDTPSWQRRQRQKESNQKKALKNSPEKPLILRPSNPILKNKNLFKKDQNYLSQDQKRNLSLQLLMGNHKDQLVKIFKNKAKYIDWVDNKDYHFCEYFQVFHKHSECQNLVQNDDVFGVPVYKKQRQMVKKRNRAVGLSESSHKMQSEENSERMISRSVQFQAKQFGSQTFKEERKTKNLKSNKIIRSNNQQKNSYLKQISDSDSSSVVNDILIDDRHFSKQKVQKNLQNKFNNLLKQSRDQKLGEEGLQWIQQQLINNGIKNIQMMNDQDDKEDEKNYQQQSQVFSPNTSENSFDSDFRIICKKPQFQKQANVFYLEKDNVIIEDGVLKICNLNESFNSSLSDNNNNQSGKKKKNKPNRFRTISSKKIKKVEIKDDKFGNLNAISEEVDSIEVNNQKQKEQVQSKINNFMQIKEEQSNSILKESNGSQQIQVIVQPIPLVQIQSEIQKKNDYLSLSSQGHPSSVSHFSEDECGEDEQSEFEEDKEQPLELPSRSKISQIQNLISSKVNNKNCDCLPRVLIVDDIKFNILPVRHMVSEFTKMIDESAQLIEEAGNGQIAVDMFRQGLEKECGCPDRAFKLIFMDLQMPVKGGFEASVEILQLQKEYRKRKRVIEKIEMLKKSEGNGEQVVKLERMLMGLESIETFSQQELLPTLEEEKTECRIVVLTSYTNEATINQCMNAGCTQFLNKPLQYEKLHEIMWRHFFRVSSIEYAQIYQEQFDKPYA